MIGEYTLQMLCDKYNISSNKIINKNNSILKYGEYKNIDNTLDYLINKLKVSVSNIEKCPSILYRNVSGIKKNADFLKSQKITFSNIESCLSVLSSEPENLVDTYCYIKENYGIQSLNKNTSSLACSKELIIKVEELNLDKSWNLSIAKTIAFGFTTLEEIKEIIQSEEFKEHPELFTSTTLACAKLMEIKEIIQSDEFKEHPELFTSTTLACAKLMEIKEKIQSDEFKEHPELFTSQTLAHAKLTEIQEIIQSDEFKEHPELFTSETLAHARLSKIKEIIQSDEFKEHPKLFTSETLAHAKLTEIQEIIRSDEFKGHPELFTSSTLAHAKLTEIQEIIQSDEFKEHPDLFTSTTLAHAKLTEIQEIIRSDEFKQHPELFTSTTLAHAKLDDISELLKMSYWNDNRFKHLLTSSIVSKAKQMKNKLPILFSMAEQYRIDEFLNTSFLLFSPSQNFALINYLIDNNLPLVIDNKLNPIFGKQPGLLKRKFGIDVNELVNKYPLQKNEIGEIKENGVR